MNSYHTYQEPITCIYSEKDHCFIGDVTGQIIDVQLGDPVSASAPTPTKLIVTSDGEFSSETLNRKLYFKHKGSTNNIKRDLKGVFIKLKEQPLTQSVPTVTVTSNENIEIDVLSRSEPSAGKNLW